MDEHTYRRNNVLRRDIMNKLMQFVEHARFTGGKLVGLDLGRSSYKTRSFETQNEYQDARFHR